MQPLRQALALGWKAARANSLPGVIIWGAAVAVVLGYYGAEAPRRWLDSLGTFRLGHDYSFAFVSTAVFGGLIPAIFRLFMGSAATRAWQKSAWLLCFWAVKGLEVNALYSLQAELFGTGRDMGTLLLKTCFDQFCYVPLWGVPSMVLAYRLIERGRAGWPSRFDLQWYTRDCLPTLVANVVLWTPAVMFIYALPTTLQLPLQNLVLCFWSLMVAVLNARSVDDVRT